MPASHVDTWILDARYALRLLRKSPLFTAVATLSLAIGIGANTTIFSLANALLFRALPGLTAPDRLVDIGRSTRGRGFDTVSYPNYKDVRERATTLAGVYAVETEPRPMSLGGASGAERIYGQLVTGNYFDVLGTSAARGRLLRDEDDRSGGPHVAVISDELWERRFAADPAIVGREIVLNGGSFAILGVTPRGFQGTTLLRADLWVPASLVAAVSHGRPTDLLTQRGPNWLLMGGRLKDGMTLQQARAELTSIAASLEREHPDVNRGRGLVIAKSALVPGRIDMVAGFLGLLMAIVGLVLLIACVNIAGMLLARAAGRRREIAVRLAIGAARGRLIRQLLTETLVLFAAGCAGGLLLTRWLTPLLLAVLPQIPIPIGLEIPTDWRVVGFAVAASFGAALLSGLAPALQASRADVAGTLKAEGLHAGASRLRLCNAFVVGQVTMSLLLVIVGGLFLRSLQHASRTPPGFDATNVDIVSLDLSLARYTEVSGRAFVGTLLEHVRALPGVDSATLAVDLPLDGGRFGLGMLREPGAAPDAASIPADWNIVEPGLFATLRLPLARGRDFSEADTTSAPGAIIVNGAFARRVWPGQEALGRQLELTGAPGTPPRRVTVVGIASDARLISLGGTPDPYVYVPFGQQYMARASLLIRTSGRSAIPQVRHAIRELDPNLPVTQAMPLSEITAIGLVPQRLAAAVAGTLGALGMLLAAIGIYGVTSYAVSQRTREIGIRMALGADNEAVVRLVIRQGVVLAAMGVAIGTVLAAVGSRFLESLLLGVGAADPMTFAGACVLFAAVALVASYLPARRAARVDPMIALRCD